MCILKSKKRLINLHYDGPLTIIEWNIGPVNIFIVTFNLILTTFVRNIDQLNMYIVCHMYIAWRCVYANSLYLMHNPDDMISSKHNFR